MTLTRSLRALTAALACSGAALLLTAATADARPVITGYAVTPDRYHPNCEGRSSCVRFTFRAYDPTLPRGATLHWRFIAARVGDGALKTNQVDTFRNDGRVQRWWAWPSEAFARGLYLTRLTVTGSGTAKSGFRVFRWR